MPRTTRQDDAEDTASVEIETIPMRHETDTGDYTLAIGDTVIAVAGGVAYVPVDLVDAAMQAGFRPATGGV